MKYFNRTVKLRLSNRTVASKYSVTVVLLEILCEKERKTRLVEQKWIVKVKDLFFALSFWLTQFTLFSRAETPFQKS